jgi:hypothetical protein
VTCNRGTPIAQAITGSWRLGLASFLVLPACLSGAVLVTFATGQQGTLAAAAGLLAVFALAARLVIGVSARLRARGADPNGSTGDPDTGSGFDSLAQVAVPAGATAVTLVPFIVMGDVPGMELLHTAAAVILGGLATTALACLVVVPVTSRLFGPALTVDSDETLPGIAMAGRAGIADGIAVPTARQHAEAMDGQTGSVHAADVEPALVRDRAGGHRDGPPHPGADPSGGPPADAPPQDAAGSRGDA